MRAKMEQDAAAAGVKLRTNSTQDPAFAVDSNADASTSLAGTDQGAATAAVAPRRPTAFDAVAGTAKDPLNNKTFDLSYPKTVPSLK
ncbi:MAG: hypothetical protein JO068_18940 [Hyphomicrobiales bacterium]|nr:hypothetical protein [Hyphomicrobiales bacterium]